MAKEFQVVIPHNLPAEEAQRRVQNLLQDLRKIYANTVSDVQEQWKGNTCTFSMKMFVFKIQGTINVSGQAVEVRGKMPLGTGKYEDRVKMLIEQRAKGLLAFKPPKPPTPLEHPGWG
jgi:putative polyhydroxyalkanoic acid system protein